MKRYLRRIGIFTLIFFIPSVIVVIGFSYYVSSIFHDEISLFDEKLEQLNSRFFEDTPTRGVNTPLSDQLMQGDIFVQKTSLDLERPEIAFAAENRSTLFGRDDIVDMEMYSNDTDTVDGDEKVVYQAVPEFVDFEDHNFHGFISDSAGETDEALFRIQEEVSSGVFRKMTQLFYILVLVVFGLSVAAAWFTLKPLKESLRKQKQFIADASHEIKTPLALMRSEVELFSREHENTAPIASSLDKFAGDMLTDINRLSRLTERLLLLAQLDDSEAHEKYEKFSVEDMKTEIQNKINCFAVRYQKHNVVFQDEQVYGAIWSNKNDLIQILEIILENACSYTPEGTKIVIRMKNKDRRIILSIADNGPGISKCHLGNIFKRFYRGNTSQGISGNGLGLSIAKRLVERSRGTIVAESELGEGIAFIISYSNLK